MNTFQSTGPRRAIRAVQKLNDAAEIHAARSPTKVNLDPAEAIRTAAAHLAAVEHELSPARAVLAAAEAALAARQQSAPIPDGYTTAQVAYSLGLSRSTVAELLRRGDIRSVKLGGARRVFRADRDAYIAGLRGEAS